MKNPLADIACSKLTLLAASKVSLIVGSILNIINQGDVIFSMNDSQGSAVSWGHIIMNYLVPFCVAAYSRVKTEHELRSNGSVKNLYQVSKEKLLHTAHQENAVGKIPL
jgi:hypothetical protein